MKRQYIQKHAAKSNAYEGLCHKDKNSRTENKSVFSTKNFQKVTTQADSIVRASYVVAYLMATKSKPFIDGEFIKQCIENVADITCSEKKGRYF